MLLIHFVLPRLLRVVSLRDKLTSLPSSSSNRQLDLGSCRCSGEGMFEPHSSIQREQRAVRRTWGVFGGGSVV